MKHLFFKFRKRFEEADRSAEVEDDSGEEHVVHDDRWRVELGVGAEAEAGEMGMAVRDESADRWEVLQIEC